MNMHVKTKAALRVGDRVKCIGEDERTFGKVGTLIKDDKSAFAPYLVAFLDWREGHGVNDNEWWLAADDVEAAPLFAVGDKVRVVTMEWGKEQHGKTGTVTRNNLETSYFSDLDVTIEYDVPLGTLKTNSYRSSELELIPTYTACAAAEVDNLADEYGGGARFHEGDRVRMVKEGRSTTGAVGKLATIGSWNGRVMDDGDYLLNIDAPHDDYKTMAVRPQFTRIMPDGIEPATLTIRAGAYYKTCDGRKVGPMEHRHAGFTWRNHGEVRYVDAEGKHIYGLRNCDLIAEWPAEWPATPTTIADIVRKHSGTAIVCLIENGQPKPSTLPFVHLNKDAAATEANRLAGIHQGKEFGVYACVDVAKVERVYEHEWQRLAARGSKIPAIKALRDMAGIDLAAAKSGVDQFLVRAA